MMCLVAFTFPLLKVTELEKLPNKYGIAMGSKKFSSINGGENNKEQFVFSQSLWNCFPGTRHP